MLKSWEPDLEEADVMLGRQLAGQRWGGGSGGSGTIQLQYKLTIAPTDIHYPLSAPDSLFLKRQPFTSAGKHLEIFSFFQKKSKEDLTFNILLFLYCSTQ